MAAGPGACHLPQLQPDGAVPSATQRDWELGGMGGRNKPQEKTNRTAARSTDPGCCPLGGAFCVGRFRPGELQCASDSGGSGGFSPPVLCSPAVCLLNIKS